MTDDRRAEPGTLKGISGWLAAFLFLLGAVVPIRALGRLVARFSLKMGGVLPGDSELLLARTVVDVLLVTGCLAAAALLLFRRKWGSVRATIVIMAVLAVLDFLSGLWTASRLMESAPSLVLPMMMVTLFQMPLFAGGWTAYLLRSTRVANTYHRPGWVEPNVFS